MNISSWPGAYTEVWFFTCVWY